MNAGLSNLATLKAHLLPSTWQSVTNQDDALLALGLGVLGMFEAYCSRQFPRVVGDVFTCAADGAVVILPRSPVEEITTLEYQASYGGTWEAADDNAKRLTPSGVLSFFSAYTGGTLRITFTGGYWFDSTEDQSDTKPDGAVLVPYGLTLAWLLQCHSIYTRSNSDAVKAGLDSGNLGALSALISGTELLPGVKSVLEAYRRQVA